MSKAKDIVSIGTVAMDVIEKVSELPRVDGFAVIQTREYLPGGSASNVIAQSAKLGASCGFIAKVGDDDIGGHIIRSMSDAGIDVSSCKIKKQGTSLHTSIIVDDKGQKFILLNMGDSFLELTPEELNLEYVKDSSVFYTDLLPLTPSRKGLEAAYDAGCKTVLNIQIGIPLMEQMGVKREHIFELLPKTSVFAPCREASEQLSGTDKVEEQLAFFKKYCKGIILLTRGSEGSWGYNCSTGEVIHQCIEHIKPVDTTGAGDSFLGAFMVAYYISGYSLAFSLEFATHCAAVTCLHVGARSGPDGKMIRDWMNST